MTANNENSGTAGVSVGDGEGVGGGKVASE